MSSVLTNPIVWRALREGLLLVLLISAPPLLASLVVGVLAGALQTVTQIQDATLTFVPKLAAVALVLVATGPVLALQVMRFAHALWLAMETVR